MWKKLSTKTILNHSRLVVVEDKVELPSGHKTDYIRFEIKGNSPIVIAISGDNKILVLKEYSYPVNDWLYEFPGGFVPDSEDLGQGINRELMEESNLKAGKLKMIGSFYPIVRRTNLQTHVFVAHDLIEHRVKGDEEEEIKFFGLQKKK